jgi:hypothetical protein
MAAHSRNLNAELWHGDAGDDDVSNDDNTDILSSLKCFQIK